MKFLQQPLPLRQLLRIGDRRAAIQAGNRSRVRSLWSTPPGFRLRGTSQAVPAPPGEYRRKGGRRQESEAASAQEHGVKPPTADAPQRGTTAPGSGRRRTLPPASCSLLLPTVFLYGYIKLAETHSTVLRGATRYDWTNGDNFFQTHRPTWDDIIQLLVSLFSPEERHGILTEARKWLG